jgi:hypothetical protein
MKDLKHIRRFNEHQENLNISDVSDSILHPQPIIGETLVDIENDDYDVVRLEGGKIVLKPINFRFTNGKELVIYPDDFEYSNRIDDFWKHFSPKRLT